MSILIIGCHGSMGKRYQAIINSKGEDFIGIDREHTDSDLNYALNVCDRIIIATPTDTHSKLIEYLIPFQKPILCEKPVTKDIPELIKLLDQSAQHNTPFRMMFQYQLLANPYSKGESNYNYFKHGSDGLVWDCLQIIALAKEEVDLKETSPVWKCKINGRYINLSEMDQAYIDYVDIWIHQPHQDLEVILDAHKKTAHYLRKVS